MSSQTDFASENRIVGFQGLEADPRMRGYRHRKPYSFRSSSVPARRGPGVPIVYEIHLVHIHEDVGHLHLAGQRMCSLVCGMGPSDAATTRMAPSIWAPEIMFLI